MNRQEIREHCYAYGYSDGEVGAFLDGYQQGRADAIDECKSIVMQTLDNEMLVDTLLLRMDELKEQNI